MSDADPIKPSTPTAESQRQILENAGLFVRDPNSYPGLSTRLYANVGLDFDFQPKAYDTRNSTHEKVRCSVCAGRTKHYDGAIVRLRDGRTGLVGNCCGKNHFFGENGWTAIRNRMDRDAEKAVFEARFGSAGENLLSLSAILEQWEEQIGLVEVARSEFQTNLPQVFNAVRNRGRSGTLNVEQSIKVPIRRFDGTTEMIDDVQIIPVCNFHATWFFSGVRPRSNITNAKKCLESVQSSLHSGLTNSNIIAIKKILRDCRAYLFELVGWQEQLYLMRNKTVIHQMVDWANRDLIHNDEYKANGISLEKWRNGTLRAKFDFAVVPQNLNEFWTRSQTLWPSL